MYDDERAILEGLAAHDKSTIEKIYREHYAVIQAYIIKNNGYHDDARDVFQEAMVVLYQKAQNEHFTLNCQIRTYLYSVCRRIWLKRLQRDARHQPVFEMHEQTVAVDEDMEASERAGLDFDIMEKALRKLGEPCKSLIEAFYILKKSMPEIAETFGYTNADNAKNQKYKCMTRLKKIFFSEYKQEENG